MCGITGLFEKYGNEVEQATIEKMVGSLAHRGPDGFDIKYFGQIALGHRRLAIIDLEGGKQPLANEDEQIWITLNGEMYNYLDLRRELEKKGHKFRTNSDTETVVHAYEEWGDECVRRFRGMFAFAIVDLRKKRIFMARDQLGIKPLYYLDDPARFAFASEIQAFRKIPGQKFQLDLNALDQYLWFQFIPAPKTIFKQVKKLPPAHRMSITFNGVINGPEEYWRLESQPNYGLSENDWIDAIDETLRESVKAHLISDVPFGAFLSGGVDSSAVVAYMAQIMNQAVQTFSIGFEEQEFNETEYALQAAKRWNTNHHYEIVKPNALEVLPKIIPHFGEPFGDSSAIPTYYLSQIARKQVPMVLSGDGGDELFGGYESYGQWHDWLNHSDTSTLNRSLRTIKSSLTPKRYPMRRVNLENWLGFITAYPLEMRSMLWRKEYHSHIKNKLHPYEVEYERISSSAPVRQAQYMDIKTYLPYDILTKVDVAGMFHGLETRTPIADVKVAEFALTIPPELNVQNGVWIGKRMLKKTLERYYPAEYLNRPKKGFAVPISKWFSKQGELRSYVEDKLLSPNCQLYSLFNPESVAKIVNSNAYSRMWMLLFLDEWLYQNQDIESF